MKKNDSLGIKKSAYLLLRSFSFMGKERRKYLLGWLLASAEIIIAYVTPYLYEQLVNIVTHNNASRAFPVVIRLMILMLLLTPVICLGNYWKRCSTAFGLGEMRKKIFGHIQQLPVSKAMERTQGDYITRITNDVSWAGGMFNSYSITGLVKFMVYTAISLAILFTADWRLALISILLCSIAFLLSTILNPRVRAIEHSARQESAVSASFLMETLRAVPIVRVFLLGDVLAEKYRLVCRRIAKRRVDYRTLNGISEGLIYIFSFCAQPIGFIIGIFLMLDHQMELSRVVFLSGVMGVMSEGMRGFSAFVQFIQKGLVASQRVFEILDQPPEPVIAASDTKIDEAEPFAVEIQDVCFSYPEGGNVLNSLNLKIRNGEHVAIVGGSGGGKTTLLKLLQALYAPDSGRITFYGAPASQTSLTDIRGLSTYVPQDGAIFDCSIKDNIRLGKPGCTDEEVENAAKKAMIHDFILSLPQGYDTMVGEKGSQVSGGQKQRIAIARAIIKDAPLLLLDEATAALDTDTERQVQQGLEALMKGKTSVVVAHRLSTIQNADRIFVMEDGRIVEEGTHSQLLDYGGHYARLYEIALR